MKSCFYLSGFRCLLLNTVPKEHCRNCVHYKRVKDKDYINECEKAIKELFLKSKTSPHELATFDVGEVKKLAKQCAEYESFVIDLVEYLKGEKYLIDENSCTMTESFEKNNQWQLSRNAMINKTLKKIEELIGDSYEN